MTGHEMAKEIDPDALYTAISHVAAASNSMFLALCAALVRRGAVTWNDLEETLQEWSGEAMQSDLGPIGHTVIDQALGYVRRMAAQSADPEPSGGSDPH